MIFSITICITSCYLLPGLQSREVEGKVLNQNTNTERQVTIQNVRVYRVILPYKLPNEVNRWI